jgi:hypothetical protein
MERLLSTGELARELGVRRYQVEYLIETGVVEDTGFRLAGKRGWTQEQVDRIRTVLEKRAGRNDR